MDMICSICIANRIERLTDRSPTPRLISPPAAVFFHGRTPRQIVPPLPVPGCSLSHMRHQAAHRPGDLPGMRHIAVMNTRCFIFFRVPSTPRRMQVQITIWQSVSWVLRVARIKYCSKRLLKVRTRRHPLAQGGSNDLPSKSQLTPRRSSARRSWSCAARSRTRSSARTGARRPVM